jgi:transketolase
MTPNKDIRKMIIEIVNASGASHVGTSFSVVEILNSIFRSIDVKKIKKKDPKRDRVILSKGHAAAALSAVMFHHGLITKEEIVTYFKNGSLLAGHASHFVPGIEHSTGSLGHGASVGLGMAIGIRSKKYDARVFVITGDAELQEGSNWEAFMLAGHLKMKNFCVLVDNNGISQMGKLEQFCTIEPLRAKLESFNFRVIDVDGHNENEIMAAIKTMEKGMSPLAIICRTIKGNGVSFMQGSTVWHYRTPAGADYENAIKELNE